MGLQYCQMNNMDKFCLNWNGYDANIRESFKKLREGQGLSDVTLVTDDGQHIKAHKIILSVGSYFFSDMFMKSNHSNMLVYLKGISSDKLEPVIDFIYNGEAFITQERMKAFIETGKELKVKGLEGELTGVSENSTEDIGSELKYEDYGNEKVFTVCDDENIVAEMDKPNVHLRTNDELELQINEIIEKNGSLWRCKICGKETAQKNVIRNHAETHIEGMSHACNFCSKTFPCTQGLRDHSSRIHSEFSCNICGKTGMNRISFRKHKRNMHS